MASGGGSFMKRSKEEQAHYKSRLTDQGFNIKRYPDPLAPRQPAGVESYPKGVTPEMEQRWLAAIEASKEQSR